MLTVSTVHVVTRIIYVESKKCGGIIACIAFPRAAPSECPSRMLAVGGGSGRRNPGRMEDPSWVGMMLACHSLAFCFNGRDIFGG